ncbi:hypothetical protein M5K25_000721 [Dendrobium thyrsiflorum]|uniref:Uncharacterized protein n=1 Tax=Dendrobium thyrsiflorum TaxID=117978 RepID=A0ABD0WCX7_DENTH
MDTPLAAAVHKENVHIGGGKATVTMKHDKLKTSKTAGKERKALADLRSTYGPVAAASKDVDLKQKSAMKGNEIKKNPMTQKKQHAAAADWLSKGANLNSKSVLLDNFGKGNTPSDHILSDEEIKQCCEWAKDGIEEMGGYSWSAKDEANLLKNQTLSEIMASAIGIPISELEKPISSDEEGYETDGSDLNNSVSVPGRLSSLYTLEELDDPLGVAGIVLDDYPLPELKLDDDYGEFSIDYDAGIDDRVDMKSITREPRQATWLVNNVGRLGGRIEELSLLVQSMLQYDVIHIFLVKHHFFYVVSHTGICLSLLCRFYQLISCSMFYILSCSSYFVFFVCFCFYPVYISCYELARAGQSSVAKNERTRRKWETIWRNYSLHRIKNYLCYFLLMISLYIYIYMEKKNVKKKGDISKKKILSKKKIDKKIYVHLCIVQIFVNSVAYVSKTNIHPRSTRYPWTKQPMATDKDPSVRIQLANAIIETGNTGATIQFGSLGFPAIVARTVVVPVNNMNTGKLGPNHQKDYNWWKNLGGQCQHTIIVNQELEANIPTQNEFTNLKWVKRNSSTGELKKSFWEQHSEVSIAPQKKKEPETLSARVYRVLKTVKERGL